MKVEKIRALIIDDIALARASLRADIEDCRDDVEIVGEADGVLSGLKLIRQVEPDLIFLDIHMADGEGFDILDILRDKSVSIIFTTASDQHAIKAFQHNAVDYLLKPIEQDLLVKAIDKHLAKINSEKSMPSSDRVSSTSKSPSSFKLSLSTQDDLRIVDVADIVRLQADGNYTTVFESDGTKTMVSRSMKDFEAQLRDHGFYRSHQSHLVQLSKVKSYLKSEGGFLQMLDDSEVPVSVRKKAEVVQILKNMTIL